MSNDPMHPSGAASSTSDPPLPEPSPRRGFFVQFLAGTLGLLAALIPTATGVVFFFHPLLRRRRADQTPDGSSGVVKDEDGFLRMNVTLDALPADGTPQAFKVYDDRIDAWNKFSNVEIGTVWLRRLGDQVLALSSICPHLGCAVDYRQAQHDFFCPCHTSAFDLKGSKTNNIPPRDMDQLQAKLKPETGKVIWLKYQEFRGGTAQKIPVS